MKGFRQEFEAFANCNARAAKSFASQAGDPVSLGFAAYSTCGVREAELKIAIARLHGHDLADRMMRTTKEHTIGSNAAIIVKLRSNTTNRPARLPSESPADETNLPATRPADPYKGSEKELEAYLTCTTRTSMLAAQRPEDPVSIASAAHAACKSEETKLHEAIVLNHGQDWGDWLTNRIKQKALEKNAATISDIRSGRLVKERK